MPDRTDEPSTRAENPAHLVVTLATGPAHVHRRTLVGPGPWAIGRDPACALHLAEPTLSRRHAELRWQAGVLEVRDLGSRHGTRLDDAKVGQERWTLLPEGQPLRMGALSLEVRRVPGLPTGAAELLQGAAAEEEDTDGTICVTSELEAVPGSGAEAGSAAAAGPGSAACADRGAEDGDEDRRSAQTQAGADALALLEADMQTLVPADGSDIDGDVGDDGDDGRIGDEGAADARTDGGDVAAADGSGADSENDLAADPSRSVGVNDTADSESSADSANEMAATGSDSAGSSSQRIGADSTGADADTSPAPDATAAPDAPPATPARRRPLLRTWGPLLLAAFALAGVLGLLLLARALFVMPATPLP